MSVNKVILLGRLGRDPELRKTQSAQMSVCQLSVATSERKKEADGSWVEQTEWHRVVTFGATADNCAKYLKKGRQVFVEGRLRTQKWQDQEGKDRYTTEILANTVQFINTGAGRGEDGDGEGYSAGGGASSSNAGSGAYGGQQSGPSQGGGAGSMGDVAFDDDDIPF